MNIPVAYRSPFSLSQCWFDERRPGQSIMEIVRSVPNLPDSFARRGYVCINGEIVPRELWAHTYPKPTSAELPISVTLHWALGSPGSGSGSGLKTVVTLVAAIALVVVTAGIAGGVLGAGGLIGGEAGLFGAGLFGAGSISANILAGAVGLVGALAVSALTAPPAQELQNTPPDSNTDNKEAASATGNVLTRGGAIPRVIGTRKIFPPFVCEPVVELDSGDEYVEALYALNGPHLLADLRLDNVAIEDAEDVEIETRPGFSDDTAPTLVTRQGRTITPQIELSVHKVKANSQSELLHPDNPSQDLPSWHSVASRDAPDEIWIHLLLPGGMITAANQFLRCPIRVRMRKLGDTAWINLPELWISDTTSLQRRRQIKILWALNTLTPDTPSNNGWIAARSIVPGQTVLDPTDGWTADTHFYDGSGNVWLNTANQNTTTGVLNCVLSEDTAWIFLDPNIFPKGFYEIQIKRGMVQQPGTFVMSTYTSSGVVKDLFAFTRGGGGGGGPPQITFSRDGVSDRMILTRVISIWNEAPVVISGNNRFALVAIRALNRSVSNLSVRASGYVNDWNGSEWTNLTTTSNPAPHYRDVLSGSQNIDPLPDDLRDDDGLLAWRTLCAANDWTCDAIISDMRTQDVLNLIASCGYARPYQSDIYGVIVDNDRTGDAPVQVFSPVNSTNVRYERAYVRPPGGFLVTYRDEAQDDDQAEITVYQRDSTLADPNLLESVSYEGITDASKVRTRAQFDLDQANLRSTFYHLDTDIEAIVCRRGSLVAFQHDLFDKWAGFNRIKSKVLSVSPAGFITGLVLDGQLNISGVSGGGSDMHTISDMHLVTDLHLTGNRIGLAIRHKDGTISTHEVSNTSDTNTITFTTPFSDTSNILGFDDTNSEYGCEIVSGLLDSEYRRMLVLAITPTKDLKATLTLVDEAPDLVRT